MPAEAWGPPLVASVVGRQEETHDVVTLDVQPLAPIASSPGQFNMIAAFGHGEVPISISGAANGAVRHTIRAVGAATSALCGLQPGDRLTLRGPFGNGWPLAAAAGRDVVVVAGGVGLPPLRGVLHALLAARERYGRIALLYGARSPRDLVFAPELEAWGSRADLEVDVTVDTAPTGWRGRVGVVTRLIPSARFDPASAIAFVCGPEVMMRFTVGALRDRGVAADAVWVSLERNMECGVAQCGHCQLGPFIVCRDGPVFRYDRVETLLRVREL